MGETVGSLLSSRKSRISFCMRSTWIQAFEKDLIAVGTLTCENFVVASLEVGKVEKDDGDNLSRKRAWEAER